MLPQQFMLPLDDDEDAMPGTPISPAAQDEATDGFSNGSPREGTNHYHDSAVTKRSSRDAFAHELLTLARIHGVGIKTLRLLMDAFGSLQRTVTASQAEVMDVLEGAHRKDRSALAAALTQIDDTVRTDAERTWMHFRDVGVQVISRDDVAFPAALRAIPNAPYWLFVEGDLAALKHPLIGIVGTRHPSGAGLAAAERLTALVCREGFGVVSGLAEGIDAVAHRVGLYYGVPQVAVLGTGIDVVFPASTAGVRQFIVQSGGAIVSEYLPGDSYSRANFVQRNRIQAALALALCPVESQAQSGTAHTLRFAEQYGRPVFGVHRGTVAPKNDMVPLLAERYRSIFNLSHRAGVAQLVEWLRDVVPPQRWPQPAPLRHGHWFFEDLLRQVDDIVGDIPVATHDLEWLQEQLMRRIRTITDRQENNST